VGRSLLAAASCTYLSCTPDGALFASTAAHPDGVRCEGSREVTMWCIAGASRPALTIARAVAVAVLLVVLSGYRPRWTAIPHWYVAFSVAAGLTQPNGGDQAAQIATMLLIPVCLGDRRQWHWQPTNGGLSAGWRGAALAGMSVLRLQTAIIYGVAAGSKLAVAQWRDGTALYPVLQDPNFGMPPGLRQLVAGLLDTRQGVAVATWGTLLIETCIVVAILAGAHRVARPLAVALHSAIIGAMGLVSFGLIMIAIVLVATAGQVGEAAGHRTPRIPADRSDSRWI
jgi:antimicrobial peptide system SdpB family protein